MNIFKKLFCKKKKHTPKVDKYNIILSAGTKHDSAISVENHEKIVKERLNEITKTKTEQKKIINKRLKEIKKSKKL